MDIDINNMRYGEPSESSTSNCNLSKQDYDISTEIIKVYKKVENVKYILLENFIYNENVKIYSNNKMIDFKIISNESDKIKIELDKDYMCETLLFYIDAENYTISMYADEKFKQHVISKKINKEKIFSPDKTWINEKTIMKTYSTKDELKESDLTTKTMQYSTCKYREIYVYKYDTKREYYDDNYYLNVEGYIKDKDDYKIFYNGLPITNTIEITKEKIIKEPEYIYIEKELKEPTNDSSKETTNCLPQLNTKVQTEIIEKTIFKVPKNIYILIILLSTINILLIIKNIKKCRTKKITSIVE